MAGAARDRDEQPLDRVLQGAVQLPAFLRKCGQWKFELEKRADRVDPGLEHRARGQVDVSVRIDPEA